MGPSGNQAYALEAPLSCSGSQGFPPRLRRGGQEAGPAFLQEPKCFVLRVLPLACQSLLPSSGTSDRLPPARWKKGAHATFNSREMGCVCYLVVYLFTPKHSSFKSLFIHFFLYHLLYFLYFQFFKYTLFKRSSFHSYWLLF